MGWNRETRGRGVKRLPFERSPPKQLKTNGNHEIMNILKTLCVWSFLEIVLLAPECVCYKGFWAWRYIFEICMIASVTRTKRIR